MDGTEKEGKYSKKRIHEKFGLYEVPKFEKGFRGYDCEEVDRYLNSLVDAYNRMFTENEELKRMAEEYRQLKEKIADMLIKEQLEENRTEEMSNRAVPAKAALIEIASEEDLPAASGKQVLIDVVNKYDDVITPSAEEDDITDDDMEKINRLINEIMSKDERETKS